MNSKSTHNFNIASIMANFCLEGEISEIKTYGSGHINDTFLLTNSNINVPDYLLQRINHHVFKDVPGLTHNIEMVTSHLKKKLLTSLGDERTQKVLSQVPAKDSKLYYKDEEGNYWRIYEFIADSRSYDIVSTEQQAYEGGKAFGYFQSLLSDMDPHLLLETIVDFHNIEKRLSDFYEAMALDVVNRVSSVSAEVLFVKARETNMSVIYQWGREGILPKRITHNDTKFNNILFDANDNAKCIIDLDTVMAGHVAYDFGDAIRTIINTAGEDEPDLEKIQINVPLFKAYSEGYVKEAGDFLTDIEIESLSLGVMLHPYMQGVRFLTDYLQGDTYYKIAYPEHNLVRARAQFQLLSKLEEQSNLLREIIIHAVADNKKYKEKTFLK